MFLKSIEIRGFKSFADKTDLTFKKGVTAVVGPNGSGKSNISDAVRWVLGEQSVKSLRGGKMEDVIFAGTQFRKPVGLSQVSLTLDNSDEELPIEYSDVTISRRLYRSGESEYYINNAQCRLRDVQELFMDTGIGKEGYSIIGQGKIDAILSGRPEERRSLLEEAAGIVKFKSRKDEAEKKLNSTEQNLVRIGDILQTYEERLEPLKIESEKATAFIELSSHLKEKEVNLIVQSIDSLQLRIGSIKSSINILKLDIDGLITKKNESKSNLHKFSEELEKKELEAQSSQQEYYKNKSDYQTISSETTIIEERLKNLEAFIEKNSGEVNRIQEKTNKLERVKNEQEVSLKYYHNEQQSLNNNITSYEKEIASLSILVSNHENEINKLKDEDNDFLKKITDTKNNILVFNTEQQQLGKRLVEIEASCENYINSIKINSTTISILENSITDIHSKVKEYEAQIKKNKLEISKLNNYLIIDEKQLKELNISANKLEANHHMLLNLDKQYEGYNKAVKTLMQNISSGKIPSASEKCFVVGEVINVEKELEVAIEIALGGAISDVITKDETTAKTLINYLKSNNIGRATFLPLNIIKGKRISNIETVKQCTGYIGLASELITYNSRFINAIEYLLGRAVVAADMNCALDIAKKSGYNYKIVTLSGEVINPGGSLTGGSTFHKSTNIISRKREVEELSLTLAETNNQITNLADKINTSKQMVKRLDDDCLNLKDEIYYENIEITKLQGKISSITGENNRISQNLASSRDEIQLLKEHLESSNEELTSRKLSLESLIALQIENSQKLDELKFNLVDKNTKAIEVKEYHTALKINKAQIDEIVANKIRELERISNEGDELFKKNSLLHEEILKTEKTIQESNGHIESNKQKLISVAANLTSLELLFKDSELERIKLKGNIKLITSELDALSLLLNKSEEETHRQELSLAKLEAEIEALYSKLNEEMRLTYAEALKYKIEIDNMDSYKRIIAKLKGQISELGTINLGAIEEYKDIKEKFTFMSSQKQDLIQAKDELLKMIYEMTVKMKAVFIENLSKLKVIFNETFRELFKGGRADLILSHGDELTANIEINVEPPGKRLQNINLMSGGEKVLSAIALLFAILKMKPTPFCILDEIEAALDDANVLRYAEFLKKFSHNIQFIVITHRKGTMEISDVLYGITMEEKGISKVVSVDLNKHPALR
jgi:chromosome segregation protein